MTEKQAEALNLIVTSEYQNEEDVTDNPVWTEILADYYSGSVREFLGVLVSLQNAGWAGASHATERVGDIGDGTCWITAKGLEALAEHKASQKEGNP